MGIMETAPEQGILVTLSEAANITQSERSFRHARAQVGMYTVGLTTNPRLVGMLRHWQKEQAFWWTILANESGGTCPECARFVEAGEGCESCGIAL